MSVERDLWEATHNLCDKCGEWVPPYNDMCQVIARTGQPGAEWIPTLWYSRHFLPVVDEQTGAILCEGSPSRGQYIEGQPRDTRGYFYDERLEQIYRAAWTALQQEREEVTDDGA